MTGQDTAPAEAFRHALSGPLPARLGIAVSGGGDSLALLHLAAEWSRDTDIAVAAVTVDHGLRPEAATEARHVAGICGRLDIPHTILRWQGWDGRGNLQDAARRARQRLIADWAASQDIDTVALGHTADDQAETVLMRLSRGAGVDGLSGMTQRRTAHGVTWLRPLLSVSRQALRDYLIGLGESWIDDPSNEDPAFDRVKARRVLAALAPLGIDTQGLCAVADNLRDARAALEAQTFRAALDLVRIEAGDVVLNRAGLRDQPVEISRRLMVHALKWVSSAEYGPRTAALRDVMQTLQKGRSATLHGCRLLRGRDDLRVCREYRAVRDTRGPTDALWDGRWRFSGPHDKGLALGALGVEGLRRCPAWRDTGLPRAALSASPAVWRDGELIAAPLAGVANGWRAELAQGPDSFFDTIISH